MLQIGKTLVSLDLVEEYFCCDLDSCKGVCCIEGDAGAPLLEEEDRRLKKIAPRIMHYLTDKGKRVIEEEGMSYIDTEGDLVTQLIEGSACVYACMEKGGLCLCSLEKAARENPGGDFFKPISCALYPVRVKEYEGFTAVNFHKWKICRDAVKLGKQKGLRAYEFLKEPLIRKFGEEWYAELELTAKEYLKSLNA